MDFRDYIWQTEDGNYLKIKDMSTRHIENTINFLKRKGADEKTLNRFNQELRIRKLNHIENDPDNQDLF